MATLPLSDQATYHIRFEGGPCDGQTKTVPEDAIKSTAQGIGFYVCQGRAYRYVAPTFDPMIFRLATVVEQELTQPQGPDPKDALGAARRLLQSLAFYVPEQVRRERAALTRLRQAVR